MERPIRAMVARLTAGTLRAAIELGLLIALLFLQACENPIKQTDKDKPKDNKETPTISSISGSYTPNGVSKSFSFTISDLDSNLNCVTSMSVKSSDFLLTPVTSITFSGTAPNCSVTISPAPGRSGTATITLYVSDGTKAASTSFDLIVVGALTISGTPVLTGVKNTAYTGFTAAGSGGLAPLVYSLATGSLPTGVTLNSSTGAVSGTPTAAGNFSNIAIKVTDALGATATLSAFTMSVASYFWDFTSSTTLDSSITYSRSGGGTRINSSGVLETVDYNVPRYDFDPISLVQRGIIIEESNINMMFMTERFDNSYWTKTASSITANAVTAPDGNLTADKLVESAASAIHLVAGASIAKAAVATAYTLSVYAKAAEQQNITLWLYGASNANRVNSTFTLSGAGSISTTSAAGTFTSPTATITKLANGWYRCTVSGVSDTAAAVRGEFHLNNGATDTYLGNGTNGIYIWGGQLEAAAAPTSYIPNVNLFLNSDSMEQASWVVSNINAVTADSAVAPDSTISADTLQDASATQVGYLRQNVTVPVDSTTYVFSAYVKQQPTGVAALYVTITGGTAVTSSVSVDLNTGNYSSNSITAGSTPAWATVTSVSGYWRVSIPITNNSTAANTTLQARLYPAMAAALAGSGLGFTTAPAVASVGTAYFWGAQLEVPTGAAATTYVRKTANAVRGQDSVNVTSLGSWFEPTEGTVASEFILPAVPGASLNPSPSSFSDGTSMNKISQYLTTTGGGVDVYVAGVQQTPATVASAPSGTSKIATVYKSNDLQAAINNTLGTGTSSASMPTVTRLSFGQFGNSSGFLNGVFRKLYYYPARVGSTLLRSISQ